MNEEDNSLEGNLELIEMFIFVLCFEVGSYVVNLVVVNIFFVMCLNDCVGEMCYIDFVIE